jgi:hypothetical protein
LLAEPAGPGDTPPEWDPTQRVLTVVLAKGRTAVVPLSSYLTPDDLKLVGRWQWLCSARSPGISCRSI